MGNAIVNLVNALIHALETSSVSGVVVFFATFFFGIAIGFGLRSGIVIEQVPEEDEEEPKSTVE